MWIEDTIVCGECGTEVTLYTDGREAWAVGGGQDTNLIWHDGQSIAVWCTGTPDRAYPEDRCNEILTFTGEGIGVGLDYTERVLSQCVEPILDTVP